MRSPPPSCEDLDKESQESQESGGAADAHEPAAKGSVPASPRKDLLATAHAGSSCCMSECAETAVASEGNVQEAKSKEAAPVRGRSRSKRRVNGRQWHLKDR